MIIYIEFVLLKFNALYSLVEEEVWEGKGGREAERETRALHHKIQCITE